jgi:hypothetical protein
MVNKQDLQELAETIITRTNEGLINLREDLQKEMQEMNKQLRKDVASIKSEMLAAMQASIEERG